MSAPTLWRIPRSQVLRGDTDPIHTNHQRVDILYPKPSGDLRKMRQSDSRCPDELSFVDGDAWKPYMELVRPWPKPGILPFPLPQGQYSVIQSLRMNSRFKASTICILRELAPRPRANRQRLHRSFDSASAPECNDENKPVDMRWQVVQLPRSTLAYQGT
ncbi:uncharacterized protein ATNIH1004_001983 [Aspergillus tanneri]|uniref:Uncharacterized protein n=1 Tax=Aspergillus tanneri TaxID=1220188 RepID=A0A5M9M3V3_9EURO|nr:uncharacterized protein ATNIH1004_001983 [Aspergillus tanneri]KAA8641381.1 hypothetical protein ATNIH1004_001983 [Aspergillus tanneri]